MSAALNSYSTRHESTKGKNARFRNDTSHAVFLKNSWRMGQRKAWWCHPVNELASRGVKGIPRGGGEEGRRCASSQCSWEQQGSREGLRPVIPKLPATTVLTADQILGDCPHLAGLDHRLMRSCLPPGSAENACSTSQKCPLYC